MMLQILNRQPRKWLLARKSRVASSRGRNHVVLIAVEGMTIDHALDRLQKRWPHIPRGDWDKLEELEPEHFMGALGDDYPMAVWERISRGLSPFSAIKKA